MKTKLYLLFIALVLFVGVHPIQAQLNIAPVGNQTVLFWPTTVTNYVLQSTTNITSPNWVTVSNGVTMTAIAITNTSPAMFFRLYNSGTNPIAGMALIPAGSFTMGNSIGDSDITDANPITVYVSAFYMDVNLVSYSQWQSVCNWAKNAGYSFDNAGLGKGANHPVQTVNWYDAVKWCNARSQMAGSIPVYYTDAGLTQVYTNGDTDAVYPNWSANGYRLPTEAEWEKAARGGLSGQRFPWGDTISESQANYYGNTNAVSYDLGPNGSNPTFDTGAQPYTSLVGYFAPNGYGLCDMAGNVNEWCWDWYGAPYGQPTTTNPTGPASSEDGRVGRGGSWDAVAVYARCAYRHSTSPGNAFNDLGFRCVIGF